METIEYTIFLAIGVIAVPVATGLSMIVATWYYNRNYYLKTKIEYLKQLNSLKDGETK